MSEDTTGAAVVSQLIDAIVTRNFDRLREILAADVWMRALLPRELVETHSASTTTDVLQSWFAPHEAVEVVSTEHHTMEGREFLAYNLLVRPAWAPDVWHAVEQSGYCRVAGGHVTRLDLVCTGYFPTENSQEPEVRTAGARNRG